MRDADSSPAGWRSPEVWTWTLALAVLLAALATTPYTTRDPDSTLYAAISAQLADRPVREWIAPVWGGQWGNEGLFREHPAGIFLPAAILAKTGYPATQAAYAVNAIYQLLCVVLILRLARVFVARSHATVIACAVQLIPVAFTYRVRANQEQALLLGLLVVLYAIEFLPRRQAAVGVALATVFLTLIKGLFVVFVPFTALLWLWIRRHDEEREHRYLPAWAIAAISLAIPLILALVYENLYRAATGEPFLEVYFGRQLGVAARQQSALIVPLKIYNAFWYLSRVAWFSVPWAVVVGVALFRRFDDVSALFRRMLRSGGATLSRSEQGMAFAIVLSVVYVGLFALSDRKAERYIFPAYYAVAAAGAAFALQTSGRLSELAGRARLDRPTAPVVVWLATALLKLAVGYYLPRIKVWIP